MKRGLLAAMAIVLWGLCATPQAAESLLRRGNQSEPETLDPHRARGVSSANILRDLFEGLTSEAPDGRIVPGAAASWEISADGRRYVFTLRADARWSNGDPLTAQDFVFSLRRCADPASGAPYAQVLAPIVNAAEVTAGRLPPESLGVAALDARRVEIRLSGPTPYFLGLLTHPSTFPVHRASLRAHGARFARAGTLVSNGAYRLAEWSLQSHVRLERNPAYHGADAVAIDAVLYYPTENVASELKRYRAGEIDWTYDIPVTQIDWIRTHLADEFHTGPYLGTYFYGFNLSRPPFAGNPALRRALTMAIDREAIVDKLLGTGERPAYGFVPPGVHGYEPQRFDWADWPMARRLETARELYRQAGYGPDRPLEVELRYNTQQDHRRVAIAVAWMWKQALGVRTRLVNEEWKVFLQTRRHMQLTQVFRASWIGDYDDAMSFVELLHSQHGINDFGYDRPAYDRLLADIAAQTDADRRRGLLQQAERQLLEDLPILPIYFYVSRRLVKPYVRGWAPNIMDHHYTRHMRIEHADPSSRHVTSSEP